MKLPIHLIFLLFNLPLHRLFSTEKVHLLPKASSTETTPILQQQWRSLLPPTPTPSETLLLPPFFFPPSCLFRRLHPGESGADARVGANCSVRSAGSSALGCRGIRLR